MIRKIVCVLNLWPLAPKPAELYRWLFERYAPTGGEVLDPTAGSFTSCFVAHSMGINSIGIEKDKAFYDKAAAAAGLC